jgi:serine/threonine protein kinase/WD40 repeat protein
VSEEVIFAAALEAANLAARAAYLDGACGSDSELRHEIETLLQAHEAAGNFLDRPAVEQMLAVTRRPGPDSATVEGLDRSGETPRSAVDSSHPARQVDGRDEAEALSLAFLDRSSRPEHLGRLDHYEVLAVLGHGGMGTVFKAFDEKLQRFVAIKVMAPYLAMSATSRKRFAREARAAAGIRNDHVIDVYAVEEANRLPYFVMEFVSGSTLQERLDRTGALPLVDILCIGVQVASGLEAAHSLGLVHRDIKPANILLEDGTCKVKITDFGLARAVDDDSLTQHGAVAGTPRYMAPEQARGDAVDHRADLFSLGSVLYTMCTGQPPFGGDGAMAVLRRTCDDPAQPIAEINADIPAWLVDIIGRLHAKRPDDRFQSATDLVRLLGDRVAELQHTKPIPSTTITPPSLRKAADLDSKNAGLRAARPRVVRSLRALAAAIVLAVAGLAVTEASGITGLTAGVIRLIRPEGTVVVEVDDPGVNVTIEGDGGLVITGAGPAEVRLRPGAYHVSASKDGQALTNESFTLSRGERRLVRVSIEPTAIATTEIRRLGGHSDQVRCVAFSPDGRRAISAAADETLRVWDVETGQELRRFPWHPGKATAGAVSVDGRRVVSGGEDGTVRLWDVDAGRETCVLAKHSAQVATVALSADGAKVLSGARDGLRLWDALAARELLSVGDPPVCGVAFSADGSRFLSGGQDCSMRVWETATGKELGRFAGKRTWVWAVAFSPDGHSVIFGTGTHNRDEQDLPVDCQARLWDVNTSREIRQFVGHEREVCNVAFAPDGRQVISSAPDGSVRWWDIATGKELRRFQADPSDTARCLAFSADGRRVLVGYSKGTLRVLQSPPDVRER